MYIKVEQTIVKLSSLDRIICKNTYDNHYAVFGLKGEEPFVLYNGTDKNVAQAIHDEVWLSLCQSEDGCIDVAIIALDEDQHCPS